MLAQKAAAWPKDSALYNAPRISRETRTSRATYVEVRQDDMDDLSGRTNGAPYVMPGLGWRYG